MNMPKVTKNGYGGKILAGIGVATVLSEVVLRIVSVITGKQYELDHLVIAIGAVIGFVGFWSIDSGKTKAAAEILTNILPRFGRRGTDPIAVPETETVVKAVPTEHPTEPPK